MRCGNSTRCTVRRYASCVLSAGSHGLMMMRRAGAPHSTVHTHTHICPDIRGSISESEIQRIKPSESAGESIYFKLREAKISFASFCRANKRAATHCTTWSHRANIQRARSTQTRKAGTKARRSNDVRVAILHTLNISKTSGSGKKEAHNSCRTRLDASAAAADGGQ